MQFNGKVQLLIAEGKTKLFSSIWQKHHVKKAITIKQRKPSLSRDRGLDLQPFTILFEEYVTTFLSRNLTFYIADDVQAIQMKYLIHFKLLLWVLKFAY